MYEQEEEYALDDESFFHAAGNVARPSSASNQVTSRAPLSPHAAKASAPVLSGTPTLQKMVAPVSKAAAGPAPAPELPSSVVGAPPQGSNPQRSMLVEAIKTALREQKKACSDKGAMRAKSSAVCSWLLDVACAGNNEPLHDEVLNLAEVKNGSRDLYFCKASSRNHAAFHHSPSPFAIHYALWYLISSCRLSVLLLHQYLELDDSLLESTFEPKPLFTPAEKAQVQIPNFVAALDGGGSAFMVHASVGGGAAFFCNDGMATHFVSAPECDAVFEAGGQCDPDAVMRRLVATRDRPAFVRAFADLLVKEPDLSSETTLLVHVNARADPRSDAPPRAVPRAAPRLVHWRRRRSRKPAGRRRPRRRSVWHQVHPHARVQLLAATIKPAPHVSGWPFVIHCGARS